jgi:hypothetical protein
MRILVRIIITSIIVNATFCSFSQGNNQQDRLSSLPGKYCDKINKKIEGIQQQLDKKTTKYLHRLARQEQKLYSKLYKKDSAKAKEIFGDVAQRYKNLQDSSANLSTVYSSKLDSIQSAFKFLDNSNLTDPKIQNNIRQGLQRAGELQSSLNQTERVKTFLKERKQYLAAQLEKYGMLKELKQFNKEVYYYQQQVWEYKELLNNSEKLERKLIDLVSNIPAFKDFFKENSTLASLFGIRGATADPALLQASLASLQPRTQVNQLIQQQISAGGPNAMNVLQQNMQQAQSQLNQLKNYISDFGNDTGEMPDFKPNSQRTKSFRQRLELGTNIQTNSATYYFPVKTDVGISLGYKLNDKSIIGIGASYKIGFGKDWRNIRVSSQGASLRSFLEYSLKGSFSLAGGYELNYLSEFDRLRELSTLNAWQQSGLLGLSKVVSLKTKFFKKTKVQLLWDFLSYQQTPKAQPVLFRVGYNF